MLLQEVSPIIYTNQQNTKGAKTVKKKKKKKKKKDVEN